MEADKGVLRMKRFISAFIIISAVAFLVPLVSAASLKMYWTDADSGKIQRANLDGNDIEDVITSGLDVPYGIDVDVSGGKIYWTDVNAGKIQRANLDGSSAENLVTGLDCPYGIALDVLNSKMYWTDKDAGKIKRANLDGSNIEIIISQDNPRAIVLDVIFEGKIYWTRNSQIYRANLNGTYMEQLASISMFPVSAIDLDLDAGKMYFPILPNGEILRSNIDGSDIESLATYLGTVMGISVVPADGKIYWTNKSTGRIQRADMDGSNIEDVITGLNGPVGLAIVDIEDLSVSPLLLEFEAEKNGPNPPSQTITIRNYSDEPLFWTATENADWLTIDANSGLCPAFSDSNIITVDVNIAGLVSDIYSADIVVSAPNAINSPRTVEVDLSVYGPVIGLSDNEFYFSALEGGNNPASQVLGIQNVGADVLDWQISETCDFLSVQPSSGSSTGEVDDVNIIVDISGLSKGIYTCELTVSSPNADNNPQIITVELDVAGPVIGLSDNEFYFQVLEDGNNPDNQLLGIQNVGGYVLDWQICETCDFLSAEPNCGSSTAEMDNVNIIVEVNGLAFGIYHCELTVSDANAENNPQIVSVTVNYNYSNKLYWTRPYQHIIQRANLDGSGGETIVTGLQKPTHIDLDPFSGKMYWTDLDAGKVQRANLDGGNIENVLTGLGSPCGIALDIMGGKMYFSTLGSGGKIQRANLDGTNLEIILTGRPCYDIAVDAGAGRMFWVGPSEDTYRANLDGTSVGTVIGNGSSLDLDTEEEKIYRTLSVTFPVPEWAMVEWIKYDGSSWGTVIDDWTGMSYYDNVALDVPGGKIYWTDDSIILRANLDGTDVEEIKSGIAGTGCIDVLRVPAIYYLTVTPLNEFNSQGFTGGPFNPESSGYTLINTSPVSIDWTASATQSWLDVSPSSGTLNSSDVNTVQITINSDANLLDIGTYNDILTITTLNNGMEQHRSIKLTIFENTVANFNGDYVVDLKDFAIFTSQWLQPPGIPSADIAPPDGDGLVNYDDLTMFYLNWLEAVD